MSNPNSCQPWGTEDEYYPQVVRFWSYHLEGYVRLTLRQNTPITWRSFCTTEEGFREVSETYELRGNSVFCESYRCERDCDGLTEETTNFACPVSGLAAYITQDKIGVPEWRRVSGRYRDHSAEAMGY